MQVVLSKFVSGESEREDEDDKEIAKKIVEKSKRDET